MRRLIIGFLIGLITLGLGLHVVLIFAFDQVSSDGGTKWGEFLLMGMAWGVIAGMSGLALLVGLLPLRRLLAGWDGRWCAAFGTLMGGASAFVAGIGLLSRLGRILAPSGGRLSWLLVSAGPGVLTAGVIGLLTLLFVIVQRPVRRTPDSTV